MQVNSARMVVVSNATFIQDNALTQDQQALDFISGSVNWLLSREQLIGIAPKVPKPLTFSLSDTALEQCALDHSRHDTAHPGGAWCRSLVATARLMVRFGL